MATSRHKELVATLGVASPAIRRKGAMLTIAAYGERLERTSVSRTGMGEGALIGRRE